MTFTAQYKYLQYFLSFFVIVCNDIAFEFSRQYHSKFHLANKNNVRIQSANQRQAFIHNKHNSQQTTSAVLLLSNKVDSITQTIK